jgi:hypothetical protein
MRKRRLGLVACAVVLALSMSLSACKRDGDSTSTPGTGEEHSLPSAQAGYPAGGGNPSPEPGYPQP